MNLSEALSRFRAQEEIEPIAILRDPKSRAVALAWKYIDPPAPPENLTDPEDWNAIWESVEVDFEELSNMAATSVGECKALFKRLQSYRLIYPDGSLTGPASQYLRAETKKQLSELKG